ncbi:MAG: acyltransferase [Planctomycetaceae bacterium]|nr:acyltransferase [Planctomycetaceae bacterium]
MSGKASDLVQIVKHSVASVIFLWLIAEAITPQSQSRLRTGLRWSTLRSLGKYSYGLYVLHPLFMALAAHHMRWGDRPELAAIGAASFVVVSSLLAAWLSWTLLESPCLRLKSFFRYQGRVAPASQTVESPV